MNDQNRKKRMDFGAGRRQMSPEMLEAQRKLAAKKHSDGEDQAAFSRVTRQTTGHTPSGASYTHTHTAVNYSSVSSATIPSRTPVRSATASPRPSARNASATLRNAQSAPTHNPARPRISSSRAASVASGPMASPMRTTSRPAPAGSHVHRSTSTHKTPHKEPSGPLGSENLETLEFDSLDSLDSIIASNEPASPEIHEPKTKKSEKQSLKNKNKSSLLDGKSPFINTLNIEKRPLSGHSVNKKKTAPSLGKINSHQPSKTIIQDNVPTMVSTKRKSKKSNIALAIAIFLTVVLGAVVGTFVYLAFFQ